MVTSRKQISMVLPAPLIDAIKRRAAGRGQSITAYITRLVEQDLAAVPDAPGDNPSLPLEERVEVLESRISALEHRVL